MDYQLIAMIAIAVVTPFLSWWGSTRYYLGRTEARDKALDEWRARMEQRISEVEARQRTSTEAVLESRLTRLEPRIEQIGQRAHDAANTALRAEAAITAKLQNLDVIMNLLKESHHRGPKT